MGEITGTQYLANKLIEMDTQISEMKNSIIQLDGHLTTILAVVEALGKANKYELVRTPAEEGAVLHWKSQKGKIVTLS